MKRVLVIGCSGSGKSYFGHVLAERTGLPLVHLDMIWWTPEGTNITREEFDAQLAEVLATDEWVIDGDYKRTLEMRLARCDTVFFLDLPVEVCLKGVHERKGQPRSDLPCLLGEDDDPAFVEWIKSFTAERRPGIVELLEKYSDREIHVFHSREEVNEYLAAL